MKSIYIPLTSHGLLSTVHVLKSMVVTTDKSHTSCEAPDRIRFINFITKMFLLSYTLKICIMLVFIRYKLFT